MHDAATSFDPARRSAADTAPSAKRRPLAGTRLAVRGIASGPDGVRRALAAAPVLVGFVAVALYGPLVRRLVDDWPSATPAAVLVVAFACAVLSFLRYPAEARAGRILVVGLAIAAGLYGLAMGRDLAVADAARAAAVGNALDVATVLLVPAMLLAILRPSFALFPFLYVVLHKDLTRTVSGAASLGYTDYLPVIEVGVFLACGLCALALARPLIARTGRDGGGASVEALTRWGALLLLAAAIGAHLGNYVMSGLAKAWLDGGILSWALENPTSSLMLAGFELGTAPLSFSPVLFGRLYEAFRAIEIPLNVVTIAAQILCAFAFLHRRLLLGVTVFFDVMHVSIFLLTGALFASWIVLNSLIVVALARTPARWPASAVALGIAVALFGGHLFWNARLGWYDGRQIRAAHYVAVDAEGNEHRVPTNFFRESSYLLLARHFDYREHRRPSAHAPTSAWGQIGILVAPPEGSGLTNHGLMTLARACAIPLPDGDVAPDYDEAAAAGFIRGQHARALALAEAGAVDRYDLYPHHHVSMPFRFRGFEALDPRDVVAYRYVVETVCLDADERGVGRDVMARTVTEVPLDE